MNRIGVALLAPLLAAARAPVLVPDRDVAITYRMEQGGRVLEQRLRWSVKPLLLRIDPPTPGMFVLIDYAAHRMDIVREATRSFTEMDAPATLPGFGTLPPLHYTQGADDQVAGLPCTEWGVEKPEDPTAICVTQDGVLLRVRVGVRIVATAWTVLYAPQDRSAFRIPDGYVRVEAPR